MNAEAAGFWDRALRAAQTAASLAEKDPDAAASRAYYAAFYAVSAYFAAKGQTFTKHAAIESAVHRDLVKIGIWPKEIGAAFTWLARLRFTGDYGGEKRVSVEEAGMALEQAKQVIQAIRIAFGEPLPEEPA